MYKVPFIKPKFPSSDDIQADYRAIVESNWFTNFGPYESRLCQQVTEFLGDNLYVTTVANATLAIDVAVRSLFKGQTRKEIIVPSFTFAAGPEVLITHDLVPVFIDIEQETLQPSLAQASTYIEAHKDFVGGILLCNIFGVGNRDIKAWEELARAYQIPIIVDSAAGFGSQYTESEYIGGRGDCEIFSLHATKPFSVGEGGFVVSRNADFIEKIRALENFGFDSSRTITAIGTNAKLQELNCAIGLRQLEGLKDRLKVRQASLRRYKRFLEPKGYIFQDNDELSTVAFVSAIAPTKDASDLSEKQLKEAGIETKRYYAPLHNYPILMEYARVGGDLSITNDIATRILSLPLHDNMSDELIEEICQMIVTTGDGAE